jgi:hypothetical protein
MSQAEKLFIQFHPSHGCSYQYFLHGKLLCSIVSQRTVFLQTRDAFHFGTVVFTKKKKKKKTSYWQLLQRGSDSLVCKKAIKQRE